MGNGIYPYHQQVTRPSCGRWCQPAVSDSLSNTAHFHHYDHKPSLCAARFHYPRFCTAAYGSSLQLGNELFRQTTHE